MSEVTVIALWKSVVWLIGGIFANLVAIVSLNALRGDPLFKGNRRFFNFSTYEDMILSAAAIFAWPMVLGMIWVVCLMELWNCIKNAIVIFKE